MAVSVLKIVTFSTRSFLLRESSQKFVSITLYYTNKKLLAETDSNIVYKETASDYGIGKKHAIAKLQELFNLKLFIARNIVMEHKKLYLVTGKKMTDNYYLLQAEGVTDDIILKYPDVLAQKQLDEKIKLLRSFSYKINDTVPLLNLEMETLKRLIIKQTKEYKDISGGRIEYLAKTYRMSILETCNAIADKLFLFKIDRTKLEKNYELLTAYGIEMDEIKKDFWVLRYNYDMIKHRLDVAKTYNLNKIKTWMVRVQEKIFNTYIRRRSDNKLILGDSSLAEYLSERLECTTDQAKVIISKHPALSNKQMTKIKQIIDFLFADGFTPYHIVRNPKILLHSMETTQKRLKELKAQGMKLDSLYILTKSQKQYKHYYNNLVKCNKSKIAEKK